MNSNPATYVDFTTFDRTAEPKIRGAIVTTGPDGKEYKSFICHGCQSCWHMEDEDTCVESYPHFLAPFERTELS